MESPIVSQLNNIASSPYRIAPERKEEFRQIDLNENFSITFEVEKGFRFCVNTDTKEISTTISTLEYLWASTYFNLVFYSEYQVNQSNGNEFFDTGKSELAIEATNLLKWAENNLSSPLKRHWPPNSPCPKTDFKSNSLEHLANELFLCGVAWIIHHEIAHITLKHSATKTLLSRIEEKDADIAATNWILEKCENEQELSKRIMGIVSIILALQLREYPNNSKTFETHPKAFERVDYCLYNSFIEDDHKLYAFAAAILQIQLAFKSINVAHSGNTFRDIFSEYLIEYNKYFS